MPVPASVGMAVHAAAMTMRDRSCHPRDRSRHARPILPSATTNPAQFTTSRGTVPLVTPLTSEVRCSRSTEPGRSERRTARRAPILRTSLTPFMTWVPLPRAALNLLSWREVAISQHRPTSSVAALRSALCCSPHWPGRKERRPPWDQLSRLAKRETRTPPRSSSSICSKPSLW